MTDEKIIDLFFARDEAALTGCEVKYGKSLRCVGNRITDDEGVTDECVNDTYMRAWETVPPKNPKNYLFTYLCKILRNLCFDRIRLAGRIKRGASVTILSNELTEACPDKISTDAEALRNELSELIAKFISRLKSEQREIFTLRYFYMEELKFIASHLCISEGKVKTILRRTREKLKIFLENYGYCV